MTNCKNGNPSSDPNNSSCNCDIGFFDNICSETLRSIYPNPFLCLQIIFVFAYFVLAGFTWSNLLTEIFKVNRK